LRVKNPVVAEDFHCTSGWEETIAGEANLRLAGSVAPITVYLVTIITNFPRVLLPVAASATECGRESIGAYKPRLNGTRATTAISINIVTIITKLTSKELIITITTENLLLNTGRKLTN
jgi:hypothetical protein